MESCLYRDFGCVWLLSVMKFCECEELFCLGCACECGIRGAK